jgi:hypothetical protein
MIDAAVTQCLESDFPELLDFLGPAGADDAGEVHAGVALDRRDGTKHLLVKIGQGRLSGSTSCWWSPCYPKNGWANRETECGLGDVAGPFATHVTPACLNLSSRRLQRPRRLMTQLSSASRDHPPRFVDPFVKRFTQWIGSARYIRIGRKIYATELILSMQQN